MDIVHKPSDAISSRALIIINKLRSIRLLLSKERKKSKPRMCNKGKLYEIDTGFYHSQQRFFKFPVHWRLFCGNVSANCHKTHETAGI
jgi:hypothetical protein